MGSPPKMTIPTQLVLRALLQDPAREMYGLEIAQAAGLQPGTIHAILARFEGLGWLESHWEDLDPREAGRPLRRYYRLSPDGADRAREALAHARTKAPWLPGWIMPQRGGAA
ncbi:PadR family transcriptional regulator [Nonomuraea endophytica]|uniref:DNA-binding PadR family transcriptional regulator n=1 Tax=Nonomuraea endophytica TaxID=714136 RepID=A0A7W8A9A5_9ACTN|nr:helix-turn-helix transcriptional regulator [Nonomuraea endophytica]MBB5081394.1 DNA-binding PadR family transcriptional regulator [Nonomuraea endophytica]